MKYPYIGSDLDGTIVKNNDFKILEETVNDINDFQNVTENNFFIVTGRAFQNMKYYIRQLNVKLPVISSNGAAITDPLTSEVYYEHLMEKNLVVDLLRYSVENDLDVSLYTATTLCALSNAERVKTYKELYGHYPDDCQPDFILYEDYHELIEEVENDAHRTIKLMYSLDFETEQEKAKKLIDYLKSKDLYHPSTVIQSRILVDAMPKGINKASGIRKWAEIMNVDLNDIHVIGDNNNDIEMVSELPFGIAVGNAVDNLKQVAWKIIDDIENNGVGKYVKELVGKG
ncbi:Cof-type HAD-IIB family hydrolase [Spiroplasma diminutum]|uniref:HAD family hydrolase n=1 Tax=Spiroplasma diminutum CUAS-1 TaxID=1276221 RepID=S5M0A1_9MOLU|nr:Cof-type HAD-IIB family hydrolase [Spiroplasma diminutum]AGR42271.1 HAD family hydrolase [Spiroplasma diminutum CUAS-1]